jgi:OOP family OmpA-OmpF porin
MRIKPFAALVLSLAFAQLAQAAPAVMPEKDTAKGQDHSLLTRFQGSKLVGYGLKEFDEVTLVAGKRTEDKTGKYVNNLLRLEGKYTRIAYVYPADRSSLEVMRNYQAALEKAGLKPLFSCAREECGKGFGGFLQETRLGNNFIQGSENAWAPFNYGRDDNRYLLAKGTLSNGAQVHVAVHIVSPVQDKLGGVYVEVVEAKAMETGKVSATLNASDMAKGIEAEGKVAIYGVYFDTDKADLKPESKASLAEMAKLLQKDPSLKVHIVGHTDNQGTLARNLDLSQKRAESVIKALTSEYKIDAKRLSAKGIASYAPVASNSNDAGREKNRRVELVKQ